MLYTNMYSNIEVYQKYLVTSIKVGCATRSLYASSGPNAENMSFWAHFGRSLTETHLGHVCYHALVWSNRFKLFLKQVYFTCSLRYIKRVYINLLQHTKLCNERHI